MSSNGYAAIATIQVRVPSLPPMPLMLCPSVHRILRAADHWVGPARPGVRIAGRARLAANEEAVGGQPVGVGTKAFAREEGDLLRRIFPRLTMARPRTGQGSLTSRIAWM